MRRIFSCIVYLCIAGDAGAESYGPCERVSAPADVLEFGCPNGGGWLYAQPFVDALNALGEARYVLLTSDTEPLRVLMFGDPRLPNDRDTLLRHMNIWFHIEVASRNAAEGTVFLRRALRSSSL